MRIESNSSAIVYGDNYKPKSAQEAKEDLPQLQKQLASEEENLVNLLKKMEGFNASKGLISQTTGLGEHLDSKA